MDPVRFTLSHPNPAVRAIGAFGTLRTWVFVAPQVADSRIPRPALAVAAYPLVVASAGIADRRLIDILIEIQFTAARAAFQPASCAVVESVQGVADVPQAIDLARPFVYTGVLDATRIRAERQSLVMRPIIIDMDAATANLEREHCEDNVSPTQRCSHVSPRKFAAPCGPIPDRMVHGCYRPIQPIQSVNLAKCDNSRIASHAITQGSVS